LTQRKAERSKKEELSHHCRRYPILDISDSSEEDGEAAEAMAELDKFEETKTERSS